MKKFLRFLVIVLTSVIVLILGIMNFPIGINTSDSIIKRIVKEVENEKILCYTYGENVFAEDYDSLKLPYTHVNLVYKNEIIVKEVYTSRFKKFFPTILKEKFLMIGNEKIVEHTGFLYDPVYYNIDINVPEIVAENIKEISLCEGTYHYYWYKPTDDVGTIHDVVQSLYSEEVNKEVKYKECDVKVVESHSDLEYIENFVENIKNSAKILNQDGYNTMDFEGQKVMYRIEFKDEGFPFYLIVAIVGGIY